MDLAGIYNSDRGAFLDPWPHQSQQPSPAGPLRNSAATDSSNPNPSNTPMPEPEPARVSDELVGSSDTSIDASEYFRCSKWVGRDFNSTGSNKRPAKLMSIADMETARKIALYRLHSADLELNEGDTMVFIDYPTAKISSASQADCQGVSYRSQKFRVHSEKLLATGSSKFQDMLKPTYQFRVLRRRGLVNQLPETVKYVLDLSPPFEGDQLVFEMTELSLTPGIIKWWTSEISYHADPWLVSGHDDICACLKEVMENAGSQDQVQPSLNPRPLSTNTAPKFPSFPYTAADFLEMKRKGENEVFHTPKYRKLPEYCPIRHRNSLIRLLMIIEGREVPLDSASRLWTLVNLAKIWDCSSVMRDLAAQWIMHGDNTRFIEVLPEEALQIGTTLELPEITQCAFRILVNELALKLAATFPDERLKTLSVFGRKLGDLPDELRNIVQHAARSLVERKSKLCAQLEDPSLLDLSSSEEWNTLRRIERIVSQEPAAKDTKALELVRELIKALYQDMEFTFSKKVNMITTASRFYLDAMDEDRATYVEPRDFATTRAILAEMDTVQRLLCPFIYNEFGEKLDEGLHYSFQKGWDNVYHRCLPYMVQDLKDELEQIVRRNPQLQQSEEWAPILDPRLVLGGQENDNFMKEPLIGLEKLEGEVKDVLRPITLSWLRVDIEPPLNITRHLFLNLTIDEMKYLPLWAGGWNDETGGVFESYLPPAELGPTGPGPSYHTGLTIPSETSSISDSVVDDMRTMRVAGSTTEGSLDVRDSVSTVYNPNRVIADDVSVGTESFTLGGSEYDGARYEIPADHQPMGQALALVADTNDSDSQATTTDLVGLTSDGDDDMSFWGDPSDDDFSDMEI